MDLAQRLQGHLADSAESRLSCLSSGSQEFLVVRRDGLLEEEAGLCYMRATAPRQQRIARCDCGTSLSWESCVRRSLLDKGYSLDLKALARLGIITLRLLRFVRGHLAKIKRMPPQRLTPAKAIAEPSEGGGANCELQGPGPVHPKRRGEFSLSMD